MGELTAKQSLFVAEYLKDLNATQAAIRAGYSKKTANKQGARLLTFVDIQKAINAAMEARTQRIQRTADEVLRDISDIAKTAKNAFMDNPEQTALASVALKALELEGKHYRLFDKPDEEEEEITPREIVFQVLPPVGDVRVTMGKKRE